jgi:hypothetical protein
MSKTIVAALQLGASPEGKAATLDSVLGFEREIAASGARLVVMPEALFGGYPKGEDFGTRLGYRMPKGARRSPAISRTPSTSTAPKSPPSPPSPSAPAPLWSSASLNAPAPRSTAPPPSSRPATGSSRHTAS